MSESLRKECGPNFAEGHPKHCKSSPKCEHNWFYDFRVNRRRYRATTETANKQEAKKFAAKERSRTLEGRRGIRQQSDITFKTFANTYLTDYAEQHKRSVDRDREIIAVLNLRLGGAVRPSVDSDAGALHAPDERAKARCARVLRGRWAESGPNGKIRGEKKWWTAGGSNSRPPRCERGALPTELAAH